MAEQKNRKPHHNKNRQRSNNNNVQRNKGGGGPQRSRRHVSSRHSSLPDPKLLQEYEYAAEGSAQKILEMAEKEQKKRLQWEEAYQLFYKKTQRIGQLFGAVIVIYLIWTVRTLAEQGKGEVASTLAVSGFAMLAVVGVFSVIAGRLRGRSRKPFRKKR